MAVRSEPAEICLTSSSYCDCEQHACRCGPGSANAAVLPGVRVAAGPSCTSDRWALCQHKMTPLADVDQAAAGAAALPAARRAAVRAAHLHHGRPGLRAADGVDAGSHAPPVCRAHHILGEDFRLLSQNNLYRLCILAPGGSGTTCNRWHGFCIPPAACSWNVPSSR